MFAPRESAKKRRGQISDLLADLCAQTGVRKCGTSIASAIIGVTEGIKELEEEERRLIMDKKRALEKREKLSRKLREVERSF